MIKEAQQARKEGVQVFLARMNKNKKHQKEQLAKEGYLDYKEFYKDSI